MDLHFRTWFEERREGDLDVLSKEFQIKQVPEVVTMPGGTKLPNGQVVNSNAEYKTSVDERDSRGTPIAVVLTRMGEEAPYGRRSNAPHNLRLSWDEFQRLWGSVISSMPMPGMGGMGMPMGGGLGI